MLTTSYGYRHSLNDELQIELVPHAWVSQAKDRWTPITKLCPNVLKDFRTSSGGRFLHNVNYYG